jgi:alpha-amylase
MELPYVCYEIFVRSFRDSNGDGIGDLCGILEQLDYLKELGIGAILLSPVCTAPSYHKYDVIDFRQIDSEYGSLEDYKLLIQTAHQKGIKVFNDLVIHHTSNQHPWFLESQKGKCNPFRDYYIWLPSEIITARQLTLREQSSDSLLSDPWHSIADQTDEKYYGMFWSGMPDLNFNNLNVQREILDIAKFWIELGADGFRLDAAKHIFPDWEDETKNHDFWRTFKEALEQFKSDLYLVGEVWAEPEKIAPYFAGLKANFNFSLTTALQNLWCGAADFDLTDFLLKIYQLYQKEEKPFIDATFTGNHDLDRIGSILKGNVPQMKLVAGLLLTLPGQPYLYYGEEIGMLGEKDDVFKREPFLWSAEVSFQGQTTWMQARYSTPENMESLEIQIQNPEALYHYYRKLIWLRNQEQALRQIAPVNLLKMDHLGAGLIAFIRTHPSGDLLVIHQIGNVNQSIARKRIKRNLGTFVFTSTDRIEWVDDHLVIPSYSLCIIRLV